MGSNRIIMKAFISIFTVALSYVSEWLKWRRNVESRLSRIEGRLDTVIELMGGEKREYSGTLKKVN